MSQTAQYALKSDLARWSLVSQRSQADRRLAWANSVCLLFLLIGVVGARTRPPIPKPVAPLEEAAPVVFEPLPPPPPSETQQAAEQNDQEKTAAPVVVVVPNTPAISFSVPTVGTLVAPTALAQAPLAAELRPQREAPTPPPTQIGNTGAGGERPEPPYPRIAEQMQLQGTVALLMTADAEGRVGAIEVKQSSGSPILDRGARDFVQEHWRLPRGQPGHRFEAAIRFVLE